MRCPQRILSVLALLRLCQAPGLWVEKFPKLEIPKPGFELGSDEYTAYYFELSGVRAMA